VNSKFLHSDYLPVSFSECTEQEESKDPQLLPYPFYPSSVFRWQSRFSCFPGQSAQVCNTIKCTFSHRCHQNLHYQKLSFALELILMQWFPNSVYSTQMYLMAYSITITSTETNFLTVKSGNYLAFWYSIVCVVRFISKTEPGWKYIPACSFRVHFLWIYISYWPLYLCIIETSLVLGCTETFILEDILILPFFSHQLIEERINL
jgi:hypothetical protein